MADATSDDTLTITLKHATTTHTFTFPSTATLPDLSTHISTTLSIPSQNQKFLIAPRPGLLKPPFPADLLLSTIATCKITLLGSTEAQIASVDAAIGKGKEGVKPRTYNGPGAVKPATPARTRRPGSEYTFDVLKPLDYLPHPERSLQFLERLRDDPGIRATMQKHRWRVPLLTEMNPAEHTTHDSKTLGLNRNGGEVIELRLRTDAYDGYRDYRTIRRTLCHELTHNVWGEHDARFWKLCGEVEKEVEGADWTKGGRRTGEGELYEPGERREEVHDHGGWTGGEFVLGSGGSGNSRSLGGGGEVLSRRDVMAKAAEERMKRQREAGGGGGGEGS